MDVYHNPEIFVRRMQYKPNWWKDYFNPEQVHWQTSILPARDSTLFWDIPSKKTNDDAENSNKIRMVKFDNKIESQNNKLNENTPPTKLIKVKMMNTPSKEKSEIIDIKTKRKDDDQSGCIFQENKSKPLSPIYPSDSFNNRMNSLRQGNKLKKQTSALSAPTEHYSAWQRIFNTENVPYSSDEGKIIKDLVLERFVANKLIKENNTDSKNGYNVENNFQQSKNLQDIIKRFNNNAHQATNNLSAEPPICNESYQKNTISDDENFSPLKPSRKIKTDINENIDITINKLEDLNLQMTATLYPKLSPLKSFYPTEIDSVKNLSAVDSNLSSSKPSVNTEFSSGSFSQTEHSFDAQKFLNDALGEEFYSSVNTTENVLPALKPTSNENNVECASLSYNEIQSVCTAEASDLLSHRDTPSTVNLKYSIKTNMSESSHDGRLNNNDKKIMYLMQQAAEQHYHMQQASKALSVCRMAKEFTFSEERLEAERLLLLAVLKNRAILEETNRMDHEGSYNETYQQGNLTISNIRVPITKSNSDSIHKKFGSFSQWYLCIGIYASQVHCSTINTPNSDNELHFDETMSFVNLPPDFELDLYIYYLEQPKNIRNFSHTSKYHLDKSYKCPTPKKFFKKHVYKNSTLRCTSLNDYIRTPSFKLAGHIKIDLNNLNTNCQRELKSVHRYLHGTIHMDIATNLHIYVKCSGFLTFGSEAGGYPSWNRHWCLLEGHCLKFWNYPSEADVKEPIGIIDLKKCIAPWVQIANQEICSKPRTLLIETARPKGPEDKNSLIMECIDDQTLIRYFLSCDTESDLKQWSKQLNLVVTFLRIWNLLDHN